MGKKSREKKLRKGVAAEPAQHPSGAPPRSVPGLLGKNPVAAIAASPPADADPWYLAQCRRAEQLLDAGQPAEASAVFDAIRSRFEGPPSYAIAVVLGRLARCSHLSGRPDLAVARAREAIEVAEQLAPSDGVKSLRGTLWSELGDALCADGRHGDARQAYETALALAMELNDARAQGVDLGQLAALALAEGRPEEALQRYQSALHNLQEAGEAALEAVVRFQIGRIFQDQGNLEEAERQFQASADIRETRGDVVNAARTWTQLAMLLRQAGRSAAAEGWQRKALEVTRKLPDPLPLAQDLTQLAAILLEQRDRLSEARYLAEEALAALQTQAPESAEAWSIYRLLADIGEAEAADSADPDRRLALRAQVRNLRHLVHYAPTIFATLARLGDEPSFGRAVALERAARCFQLGWRPDLAASRLRAAIEVATELVRSDAVQSLRASLHSALAEALAATGEYAGAADACREALTMASAAADLRGQYACLSYLGGLATTQDNPEEAREHYEAALRLCRELRDSVLESSVLHQLGRVLHRGQQWDEADRCYQEAARLHEERGDTASAAVNWRQLVALHQEAGNTDAAQRWYRKAAGLDTDAPAADESAAGEFSVIVEEEEATDYAFDSDLLVDGPRARRITPWSDAPHSLAEDVRPMLIPCARACAEGDDAVRVCLPPGEPIVERHAGCTVMRRIRRDVVLSGNTRVLWSLIRAVDGERTIAAVLSGLAAAERGTAARMLAALAATGAIDVSGRPFARFVHTATKKGVLPGGGLESEEVMRLATDDNYRTFPEAPRLAVGESIPERLQSFHALTRARRSYRDYRGVELRREELDALLTTACGVTGSMTWGGRESKLRAYPSSGGLYAVNIYPVVLRVEGLSPAVYHYRVVDNVLELVKPLTEPARFIQAMLPVERDMVAGTAAMICLAGFFTRHERKYGEGGYRMLVAEVGHISQNLILAATALGLDPRPFGGVFDELLNQDLGLNVAEEQFMLAVLVGRTGGRR